MLAINFLGGIGSLFLGFLRGAGRFGIFAGTAVSHVVRPPFFPRLMLQQMVSVGYFSLPVVGLTTLFTGMALALQIFEGSSRFNAEGSVAWIVAVGMTRELAPVLAGLMVAGRVGAAMAAEIGTMRVTEQINALTTLSTNPFKYLVCLGFQYSQPALHLLTNAGVQLIYSEYSFLACSLSFLCFVYGLEYQIICF